MQSLGHKDYEPTRPYAESHQSQEQLEEGHYADYRSEEGQSEHGQIAEEQYQNEGLDESLDVLPAGLTAAPEVYSPMSHGASRVRSMITNRPFMLEEPVSPVAQHRGATMRRGSQVTFSTQAEPLGDTVVTQAPGQQEEPLYHDWSQPAQSFTVATVEPAAAAPAAEATLAGEAGQDAEAMGKTGKRPMSDKGTVKAPKTGAMSKLTGSLFRRSGKRTAETQTTEYVEEETQTSDQPEPPTEADSQQLVPAEEHAELGQELSFGDALKVQPAPPSNVHYGGLMLSDLMEAHGPLAMTAMSSPTHTTAFVLPAEETSPAQLAGLADPSDQDLHAQALTQHKPDTGSDQLALHGLPGAADMMTFQVDGQIKLGLRPRQLTFSASAQPPPQLWPQPQDDSQAFPTAAGTPFSGSIQGAPDLLPHAGQGLSPVPLLQPTGGSPASSTATAAAPEGMQTEQLADSLQHHSSGLSTAVTVAPLSRQASIQADGALPESPGGQALTDVAPSLSWPGAATAEAVPSRQNSAGPMPPSRQPSAVVQPPSRQPSAVVQAPSRQGSRMPPPLSKQASDVAPAQPVAPLPLSRQHSGSSARVASAEPHQAAASSPRQGLEQAWAALLPSLLAEANKQQQTDSSVVVLSGADQHAAPRQPGTDAPAQSVGDILKMWAPLPKAMTGAGLVLSLLCFVSTGGMQQLHGFACTGGSAGLTATVPCHTFMPCLLECQLALSISMSAADHLFTQNITSNHMFVLCRKYRILLLTKLLSALLNCGYVA